MKPKKYLLKTSVYGGHKINMFDTYKEATDNAKYLLTKSGKRIHNVRGRSAIYKLHKVF